MAKIEHLVQRMKENPKDVWLWPAYFTRDSTATVHKTLAYCVMLNQPSLKYVQYICVDLIRMPCLQALLHRFIKKPGEICRLGFMQGLQILFW